MSATISQYLYQNVSGTVQVLTGTWIRLLNNFSAATFVSTAATDSNGFYTVNSVPAGSYTIQTGPSNTGPWTSTADVNFIVSETDSANNTTIPGTLAFSTAASQIVPGATSIAFRNNANTQSNSVMTDVGLYTQRNGLLIPYSAATVNGNNLAPNSAYSTVPVKIDDQTPSGVSTFTFAPNPLPTTFRHLLIEYTGRSDSAAANVFVQLRFNNDSTANYDWDDFFTGTSGASPTTEESLGATFIRIGIISAATNTAGYFGFGEAKIINYQGTSSNKGVFSRGGWGESNATGAAARIFLGGFGKWRTTNTAVTRLDVSLSAGNFVAGSLFTLWGIP